MEDNQLAHDKQPDDKDIDKSHRAKRTPGLHEIFMHGSTDYDISSAPVKEYEILNHNRFIAFPSKAAAEGNLHLYKQHCHLISSRLDEIKEEKRKEETLILIASSKEGNPAGLELLTLTTPIWKLSGKRPW